MTLPESPHQAAIAGVPAQKNAQGPGLVVIARTTMSVNSIETIGPIKEEETGAHEWFRQTFWVTTKSGHVVQWRGARYREFPGAPAENQAHAQNCKETADKARMALVRAAWPELSREEQLWV